MWISTNKGECRSECLQLVPPFLEAHYLLILHGYNFDNLSFISNKAAEEVFTTNNKVYVIMLCTLK